MGRGRAQVGERAIEVRQQSLESSPLMVRIMPGEEDGDGRTVRRRFAAAVMRGGNRRRDEPLPAEAGRSEHLAPSPPPTPRRAEAGRQDLTRNVLDAAVELRALLAETTLRLSDVLDMQVGDVITTECHPDDEVPVQVEGKAKFAAKLGHAGEHRDRADHAAHRATRRRPRVEPRHDSAAARRPRAATVTHRSLPSGYLKRSQLPLASLVFLLPFIILYELGTRHFAFDPAHHTEQRIIAFNLMQQFFNWFGATGRYMPPLAVVGILLSVHIAHNDPWRVKPGTLLGMAVEGAAWGVPLLAIGTALSALSAHYLPLMTGQGDWRTLFVLSLGAGIYEEMVFRLVALTSASFAADRPVANAAKAGRI